MNKNFVNYHVLISHGPSCLNRDDMNMQKTAIFGGVRRVRQSSQSLKYWIRKSDYYQNVFGKPSTRTKQLDLAVSWLVEELGNEFDAELIRKAATAFVRSTKATASDENGEGDQEEDDEDSNGGKSEKKLAVAPWVAAEMREICRAIQSVEREGLNEEEKARALKRIGKTVGKGKEKYTLTEADCIREGLDKKTQKRLDETAEAIAKAVGSNMDVALSGRMATSGLMTSIDGALAVAHSITTHAAESDIDWFTAVDDFVQVGSGHLDTQEFSAGVFYRYASLNLNQLQANLGGASRDQALKVAAHVLHLLATVVPSAKQQAFAAHNLADFSMVSLSDQPISLANAFENSVKNQGGFLKPSVLALLSYWDKVHRGFGLNERVAAFDLSDTDGAADLTRQPTLPDLEKWLLADGRG